MSTYSRQAGQNIRLLEKKRRVSSLLSFFSAVFVSTIPFVFEKAFENILKPLLSSQSISFQLPIYVYLAFLILTLGLVANGLFLWKRANHAAQGAQGEEYVAKEISQLEYEGWIIEYGICFEHGGGDIDIFCISPRQQAYIVDVKSHKGTVKTDREKLYRQMGKQRYSFEKNFLRQVMQQALKIKQQRRLQFVTPILAFSNARVLVPPGRIKGVYVVEKNRLVPLLRSLG